MTRIKICGIQSLEEALWAVEAGADALGFILVPHSKRYLKPQVLQYITSRLPPFVSKVGVFAGEDPDTVAAIKSQCALDAIQLHGGEDIRAYQKVPVAKIKVLTFKPQSFTQPYSNSSFPDSSLPNIEVLQTELKHGLLQGILLDSTVQGQSGGTGKSLPWQNLCFQTFLTQIKQTRIPVLLAGGLNPQNVKDAICLTHPYGVDVSSGVESNGKKDQALISEFIQAVRSICTSPRAVE